MGVERRDAGTPTQEMPSTERTNTCTILHAYLHVLLAAVPQAPISTTTQDPALLPYLSNIHRMSFRSSGNPCFDSRWTLFNASSSLCIFLLRVKRQFFSRIWSVQRRTMEETRSESTRSLPLKPYIYSHVISRVRVNRGASVR